MTAQKQSCYFLELRIFLLFKSAVKSAQGILLPSIAMGKASDSRVVNGIDSRE